MQQINIDWIDISKHKPEFIEIKDSLVEGKGAFTKTNIKKNTFLGNYMGKITNDFVTGPYVFHSQKDNNIISIDASDINYSNWTRYMNCSIDKETEKVNSYFLTNKENYVTKSGKITHDIDQTDIERGLKKNNLRFDGSAISSAFEYLDKNGDGLIDPNEFVRFSRPPSSMLLSQERKLSK